MKEFVRPFLAILFLALFGFWVRFRALRINPALGVDNWYWLLCIEEVKRYHRIPARLPYFMLEIEEQWYPPLYSFVMALFPMNILKKRGGEIAQLMDLLNGVTIFLSVLWLSDNNSVAFISAFSYMIAFFPLSYSLQLQPRGLSNFLLTLIVIGLWYYIDTQYLVIWLGVLILSVLLLFLHKMTTQIWVVYLFGFGIWSRDWTLPALLPASVLLAIIISKGFYLKVLKAHWDIITFWHENIKNLGSHQYYESPLYRKEGFASTAIHQEGLRHQLRKLWSLFLYNVFIVLLPILMYCGQYHYQDDLKSFMWCWLGLTYLWIFLTTFVPYFKALGAGILYLYQSFLPLFLLVALLVYDLPPHLQWVLFILWAFGLILSVLQWEKHCRNAAHQGKDVLQAGLGEVLNYLKEQPKDGVFCIPFVLSDPTAYWTRKKVFWGGHSFGFHKMLKPYFPIMRMNVVETLENHPLNYILVKNGYLDSLRDIGLEEGKKVRQLYHSGEFELYEVLSKGR
jgi:hypothetical protein